MLSAFSFFTCFFTCISNGPSFFATTPELPAFLPWNTEWADHCRIPLMSTMLLLYALRYPQYQLAVLILRGKVCYKNFRLVEDIRSTKHRRQWLHIHNHHESSKLNYSAHSLSTNFSMRLPSSSRSPAVTSSCIAIAFHGKFPMFTDHHSDPHRLTPTDLRGLLHGLTDFHLHISSVYSCSPRMHDHDHDHDYYEMPRSLCLVTFAVLATFAVFCQSSSTSPVRCLNFKFRK